MRYFFKQACMLEGKYFPVGKWDVSDEQERIPYFMTLVKAGLVFEAPPEKEVVQESADVRAKRLYAKLTAKKVPVPKAEPVEEDESPKGKKKKE
jgi:hypothetical protein